MTGAPAGGGNEGGGWLGGAAEFSTAGLGRKDSSGVDHAFAGAMLQRSTSAPPVSDHVRKTCRWTPNRLLTSVFIFFFWS